MELEGEEYELSCASSRMTRLVFVLPQMSALGAEEPEVKLTGSFDIVTLKLRHEGGGGIIHASVHIRTDNTIGTISPASWSVGSFRFAGSYRLGK